jgi:hypothetical protein
VTGRVVKKEVFLYFKHIMVVKGDSSVISKWHSSLIDDARFIIYDCNMFI